MLVNVFRHSEANVQGDEPKFSGEFIGPVRSPQGYDVALIHKEDGTLVQVDFNTLVVVTEPQESAELVRIKQELAELTESSGLVLADFQLTKKELADVKVKLAKALEQKVITPAQKVISKDEKK